MSGICGIVRFDGKAVQKNEIQLIMDGMQNRGNDHESIWVDGSFGFGQKMLWNTPESLHEKQPVISKDNNLILIADARIDNREELIEKLQINVNSHEVITDSDLILMAYENWYEECPKYLIGDFAFAIFDKVKRKSFFVKDHIGIRPFYYYHDENMFCFSSEIVSLFSLDSIKKLPNEDAKDSFLESTTIIHDETFFKNIKRLVPAHILCLENNEITLSRYWFPEKIQINKKISFEDASEKFKKLFYNAVNVRLRSAYPIGCALSGGLDSSSVLCVAEKLISKKNIKPFSQQYGVWKCDESYYSNMVAKSLNLNLNTVRVDKLDYKKQYSLIEYLKMFPDWPTYGSFMGMIPVAEQAQNQNIRVYLTGQGGDHIVGGDLYLLADYLKTLKLTKLFKELNHYKWSIKTIKINIIKPLLPKSILRLIRFIKGGRKVNNLVQNSFFNNNESNMKLQSLAFKEDLGCLVGAFNAFWADSCVYHNIERYNIETRHPFFDVHLIEFCLSLPEEYKIQNGISKRVLREAMKDILPEKVRNRKDKAEFSEPISNQLKAEKIYENNDNISGNILLASKELGILKWKKINFKDNDGKDGI